MRVLRNFFIYGVIIAILVFISAVRPVDLLCGYELFSAAATSYNKCPSRLSVKDYKGLQKGDTILIIQMKGAQINRLPQPGLIKDIAGCGQWEFSIIESIDQSSSTLYLRGTLKYNYDFTSCVQVIRVLTGRTLHIDDRLEANLWNGEHGGVIPIIARDTIFLSQTISADGSGFKGGVLSDGANTGNSETRDFGPYEDPRLSAKGEGVWLMNAQENGGAAPSGTGGGGGNSHNAGGAGGGNISKGGQGGNQFIIYQNVKNAQSGYVPVSWEKNGDRLFFGGGGGAGHQNSDQTIANLGSPGARGGGIVIIFSPVIIALDGAGISANGRSVEMIAGPDGAGGGGAGGSVFLKSNRIVGNILITANGGDGGSSRFDRCVGLGGGGAGGTVVLSVEEPIIQVYPGRSGRYESSAQAVCGTHGAAAGELGVIRLDRNLFSLSSKFSEDRPTDLAISMTSSRDTICVGERVFFNVETNSDLRVEWHPWNLFQLEQGKRSVSTRLNKSDWIKVRTFSKDGCPGPIDSLYITVVEPPKTKNFDTTVCSGTMLYFTAPEGAKSQIWHLPWSTDDSTATDISFVADSSIDFFVEYWLDSYCSGIVKYKIWVSKLSTEILTEDVSICLGDSVQLEASTAQEFLWEPSEGLSAVSDRKVVARPSRSITYYLTAMSLGCTVFDSVTITVISPEAFAGNDVRLCVGDSTRLVGEGGDSVEWRRLGDSQVLSTDREFTVSPVRSERYQLRSITGKCDAFDTVDVYVELGLRLVSFSPSAVCYRDTVELRVVGAERYEWYDLDGVLVHTGSTKSEIADGGKYYRVVGFMGSCSGELFVGYEVLPLPVVEIDISSSCVDSPIDLQATGGTEYSWSLDGEEKSTESLYSPKTVKSGTHSVNLRVTNENGCSFDTLVHYYIYDKGEVSIATRDVRATPGEDVSIPIEINYAKDLSGKKVDVQIRYDRRLFLFDSVVGHSVLKSLSFYGMDEEIVLDWSIPEVGSTSYSELRGIALMSNVTSTPIDVKILINEPCLEVKSMGGIYELSDICYSFGVNIFAPLEAKVFKSSIGIQAIIHGGLGKDWHIMVTDVVGRVVVNKEFTRGNDKEEKIVDLPIEKSGVYFLRVISDRGMILTRGISIVK